MDLVISNATVVTCDANGTVIADGGVAVENGRIVQRRILRRPRAARRERKARGGRLRPHPDAGHRQHALPCRRQPVSRAGREPGAGAVAADRVEGRGRDPQPRHVAARQRARLCRTAAVRRHDRDGHVLVSARDGAGGPHGRPARRRPAASSSIRRASPATISPAASPLRKRFFDEFGGCRRRLPVDHAAWRLHRRAGEPPDSESASPTATARCSPPMPPKPEPSRRT